MDPWLEFLFLPAEVTSAADSYPQSGSVDSKTLTG